MQVIYSLVRIDIISWDIEFIFQSCLSFRKTFIKQGDTHTHRRNTSSSRRKETVEYTRGVTRKKLPVKSFPVILEKTTQSLPSLFAPRVYIISTTSLSVKSLQTDIITLCQSCWSVCKKILDLSLHRESVDAKIETVVVSKKLAINWLKRRVAGVTSSSWSSSKETYLNIYPLSNHIKAL